MKEGERASNFKLRDGEGEKHELEKIDSKYTVLFFYPKDNTPGCAMHAKMFSDDMEEYEKMNASIYGISGGDEKAKASFASKNDINIKLLADVNNDVSKNYGVYGEKSFMGRKYMGITRTTFLLDENKNLLKRFENIKPAEHSKQVLDFLEKRENE